MTKSAGGARRAHRELRDALAERSADGIRTAEALLLVLEAGDAATLDDATIRACVAMLGDIGRTAQRRLSEVLQPLARIHPGCREALEAALESPMPSLRWGAAYTLGHACGVSRALAKAILEMLGEEDGDSRWAAAELACALARQEADFADELRSATRADRAALRRMALYCLRDLEVSDLADLARERLDDPDLHGRLAGLSALTAARLTPEEADATVADLGHMVAADPEPGARRAAAVALGRIAAAANPAPRAAAATVLEAAAASEDSSLARAARKALAACRADGATRVD